MSDESDVAKIVVMLSAAYPNWNPNQYTAEIYFQDLKDIPAEFLFMAVKQCRTSTLRDQRFAPSAGEIRKAASDLKRIAHKVPSAIEAWGELLHVPTNERVRWIEDDGDGKPVILVKEYEWSHPLVRKVAVMMGFPRFPDWDKESFERSAFLKVYESELEKFLESDAQPTEIKAYLAEGSAALQAGNQIKQLSRGMKK